MHIFGVLLAALLFTRYCEGNKVTVSGLSSGADFSAQFHVAHSSFVTGAALFAGQPYHCGTVRFPEVDIEVKYADPSVPYCVNCEEGTTLVYDHCKNIVADRINSKALVDIARRHESFGLVDSLDNIKDSKVFLYRGQLDRTYLPGSVNGDFYTLLGADVDAEYIDKVPSQHAWPTIDYGVKCGDSGAIEKCGVDGTGMAIQSLYNHQLSPPAAVLNASNLGVFDQRPFQGANPTITTQLANSGYIYRPTACQTTPTACDVHVSLHGCNVDGYYEDAVHHLSLNRWAETNNIIVLWPKIQVRTDSLATVQQQQGCWDAYGQSSPLYATKQAPQIIAVKAMVDSLLS
jgi:hypothetical protein